MEMKVEVKIAFSIESAAFDNRNTEIARVLRDAARQIEHDIIPSLLWDNNGNRIGEIIIDDEQ